MRLIEIMGGHVWRVKWFKDFYTGFPFAVVVSRGKLFRKEHVRREVRIGRYYADFSNDIKRSIEVDGAAYHDVIKDQERNEYIKSAGYKTLHIPAKDIYNRPLLVRSKVREFLVH
jgi:very-short-patch-repair endonuclease